VRKIKTEGENDAHRIVTKQHKYFTDLSDIQRTAMIPIDFEALPIKFRLVETPD
jgi:hypothetical protein